MTFANLDVYFHMLNHYKKIRQAKAVVDCSSPKGHKRSYNGAPARAGQCFSRHQPHCPVRDYYRICSPDYLQDVVNVCPAKAVEWTRCYSAPPCKRSETKDTYACRSKPREKLEPQIKSATHQSRKCPATCSKSKDTKRQGSNEETKTKETSTQKGEHTEGLSSENSASAISAEKILQDVKISHAQEHEYLHFLLMITEDILRNNIYDDDELEKLFESHVRANIVCLDEGEMRARIEQLKKELEFPFSKRSPQCRCDDESLPKAANCSCCPASQLSGGTCACNNPKCPAGVVEDSSKSGDEVKEVVAKMEDASVVSGEEAKQSQISFELQEEATCEKVQCCPVAAALTQTPDDEVQEEPTIQPEDITSNSLEENLEVTSPDAGASHQETTCEEVSCCPVGVPLEPQDKTQTQESQDISKTHKACEEKESKTSAFLLGSTKSESRCVEPSVCFSESGPGGTAKASTKGVGSKHSMFKIIHKDDPKSAESYITYYNPHETEEHCRCSVTLQKTALKIEADDCDNAEYILVDGPVCMPRSWLDTKTVPVLVQNASSMLVNCDVGKEKKSSISGSKMNLFHQNDHMNHDFDNLDSVSYEIKKVQIIEDCDLTPQRDNIEALGVADDNRNPEPILKKALHDPGDLKQKNIVKLGSFDDDDDDDAKKAVDRQRLASTKESVPVKCKNITESCLECRNKQKTPNEEQQKHTQIRVDEETERPQKTERICSTGSCEREICPKRHQAEDKIKSKEGICSTGSCNRDICPKRASKRQPESDVKTPKKLSRDAEAEKVVETDGDYAAKYHFLLIDVSTSTTTLEKTPRSSIPKTQKSGSLEAAEENKYEQYELLLNEDYQVQEEPSKPPSKPAMQLLFESQRNISQFSEVEKMYSPPKVPSPIALSMSESVEIEPYGSLATEFKSVKSDEEKRSFINDLKIFQYSNVPIRKTDSSEKEEDALTYSPKKASISTAEDDMLESYRRTSEILHNTIFPTHPALKQSSPTATASSSLAKPELKVRYSVTREMFDEQQEGLIAKLDEFSGVDSSREPENIDTITDRMRQFRKISGDENANRRFQISNPDTFEIRKVSVAETAPKTKKRVVNRSSSIGETSSTNTTNS